MKPTLLLTCMTALVIAGYASAATKAFYVTDEAVDNQHLFRLKDGSAAPVGLVVQKCVSGPSGANDLAAPTNWGWASAGSAFTNYLPPDCYEYQVGTCFMGDDDAGVGFTPNKAGQVSGAIGSSDSTRRGWLRAFSGTSIPGSAYYADANGATSYRLLADASDAYQWGEDPTITNINPAYVIPFVQPPTQAVVQVVSGQILVGPGNNVLPYPSLLVEYQDQGGGPWQTLTDALATNGMFSGVVSGPFPRVILVRARARNNYTPRPGLPISQSIANAVTPEPTALLFLALMLLFPLRARRHAPRGVNL